jgi:uncharacterized protein DUF5677
MGPPWSISKELENLHDAAIEYAVKVHRIATEMQVKDPHISYQALAILHMRAVTIHRAIRDLCELGWTPVTSILIRTLLDLYANVVAIAIVPENVQFMAFRYLTHHRLARLNDTTVNKEEKGKIRTEAEAALSQIPKTDAERIRKLLDDYPRKGYWYQPEFASPTSLLNQTKGEMAFIYRVFSGSVHGGMVGLGFLDDDPDEFDINHREHPRRTPLAIAMSSRLLLETTFLRDCSEKTNRNELYFHVRDNIFMPLREILEAAQKRSTQTEHAQQPNPEDFAAKR